MTIQEALIRVGNQIVSAMKTLAPKRSGTLANSIKNEGVTSENGTETLTISMLKYGQYQDSGVQGSFAKFANGREPKPFKNKFTGPNQKSFFKPGKFKAKYAGIGNGQFDPWRASVAYYGFRPQPFIGPGIERVVQGDGKVLLTKAGIDTITTGIEKELKDIKINA